MQQARKAQGTARTFQQLKAIGMSDGRASHVIAAREEKEKLRNELRELMHRVARTGADHGVADIFDLKPKALRENIERLRSELGHLEFMGERAAG